MTSLSVDYQIRAALERSGVVTALVRGDFKADRQGDVATAKRRIRCPACAWEPERRSLWTCGPVGAPEHFTGGCGHSWNTFDTRGRCPGCSHQWRYTACLKCHRWSLHQDWYEPAGKAGPA